MFANDFPWIPHAHTSGVDDGDVEYHPLQLQLLLLIFILPPNKHLEKSQSQPQLQQHTQTPNDCNKFTHPTKIIQQVYQ